MSFQASVDKILAEAEEKRAKVFQVTGTSSCRTCQPFEGKMFSQPAGHMGLPGPEALSGGLFHSGCQHSVTTVEGSESEMRALKDRHVNETGAPRWTPEEKRSLDYYQTGSADMNGALRGGKKLEEHPVFFALDAQGTPGRSTMKVYVDNLDSAMAKGRELPPGTTLYRGIRKGEYAKMERAALNGKVYTDRGYLSTTTSKKVADDFMEYAGTGGRQVVINAPRGTRAVPMDEWVRELDSAEMLLPRGTRFNVTFASNKVDIILEVI